METLFHTNHYLDDLTASLNQVDALVTVISSVDLTELKTETMLNYFWVISNIIMAAKNSCDTLLTKQQRLFC